MNGQLLRTDALAIWQAGVDAVRSDRLVKENVQIEQGLLCIAEERVPLDAIERIVVVGAGKAGAGMAAGLEEALGDDVLRSKKVQGWINVPEDCVRPLRSIHLHGARPAGLNEPTQAGVAGANEILRLAASLGERDLCICLISGGGSALLPAPVNGVTLEDKLAVTKHLSAAGANIQELNTVRKQLSRIKGGGLARACRAGRLITLVISDVLGDPLDVIASGPTVEDSSTTHAALEVLEKFQAHKAGVSKRVFDVLFSSADIAQSTVACGPRQVSHYVIGNLARAVDAAGIEAERRGYSHAMTCAIKPEGDAELIGQHLAAVALRMREEHGPDCLITGGEPTVRLAPQGERGKGGRNQQLVLSALQEILRQTSQQDRYSRNPLDGLVLLSGGTDGEDGPTDAAGALIDADIWQAAESRNLNPEAFLRRNDAYHFFEPTGGLMKTGPTHTNVCDIRIVVVGKRPEIA
jgi:hydroxypyruvate reductase